MSGLESNQIQFEDSNESGESLVIPRSPTMPLSQDRADEVSKELGDESDSQFPENPDVVLQNALLLIDQGKYRSALRVLRRVVSIDPDHREAIYWLGYCFASVGDSENSLKCYQALVKVDPSEDSFAALADQYYLADEVEKAKECYFQALQVISYESPLLFTIYKNLGNIFVLEKDYEAAEEFYNKAHTIYSNSDDLYVNFGTLEIQKGNIDLAHTRFTEAVKINSRNEKAWVGLAMISREKFDTELASAQIKVALELNPNNQVALQLLVQWSFADDNYENAITAIKQHLETHSEDVSMSYTLAGLLFEVGQIQKARVEIERTIALDPNNKSAIELKNHIVRSEV